MQKADAFNQFHQIEMLNFSPNISNFFSSYFTSMIFLNVHFAFLGEYKITLLI